MQYSAVQLAGCVTPKLSEGRSQTTGTKRAGAHTDRQTGRQAVQICVIDERKINV